MTDPAVVALGIVILAALSIFYTEISGFGITLGRRVGDVEALARQLKEQVTALNKVRKLIQETQSDFADTNKVTGERLARLERASQNDSPSIVRSPIAAGKDAGEGNAEVKPAQIQKSGGQTHRKSRPTESADIAQDNTSDLKMPRVQLSEGEVRLLAAGYNLIRGTMVAGPERSTKMERNFRDMRSLLVGAHIADGEIRDALYASDRGRRLSAYACLVENPDEKWIPDLIDVAASEDKPFGQLCALRAVRSVYKRSSRPLQLEFTNKLNKIAIQAGPGTDRYREVTSILADGQLRAGTN